MGLSWRRGGLADLTRCLALLQGHCAYDSATLERLPAVWQALFQDAAVIFSIVEDQARPLDCRVLAFGASVFVTDSLHGLRTYWSDALCQRPDDSSGAREALTYSS